MDESETLYDTANHELQQEELSALEAIYGEDCKVNFELGSCELFIPNASASPRVVLDIQYLPSYPSEEPPLITIHAPHLPKSVIEWIQHQLKDQFTEGEVALFNWTEWLKEQTDLWEAPPDTQSPSQQDEEKAIESVSIEVPKKEDVHMQKLIEGVRDRIIHGEPFTEKRSTFQAHICAIRSAEEVNAVMSVLLENGKIRNATHNIMAYRIHDEHRNTFNQDYNDDGETAAGGRLLHLLQVADVSNVIAVVSRWFGGILLGPARFSHINNAARNLLEEQQFIVKKAQGTTKKKKKKKK